jgi:hypothetical protein
LVTRLHLLKCDGVNIDPFLAWLESTALSQWVIGSTSLFAFPGILSLHAIGMGFAVGISVVLDLRILGVARSIPLVELRRFLPILWGGFWLNAVSGLLLLIGYPTKALTNPVFYLKLLLIAAAMVLLMQMSRRVFDDSARQAFPADSPPSPALRRMAIASLLCWTGAITAGRLLAYTYTRLTVLE